MVVFASFIGAVAILAGAASAVPMDYGPSSSGYELHSYLMHIRTWLISD
jgi:hypothetical protein